MAEPLPLWLAWVSRDWNVVIGSGVVALVVLGIACVLSSVVAPGCSWGAVCSVGGVVAVVAVVAPELGWAGVAAFNGLSSGLSGMMTIFLPPLENTTGLNGSSTSSLLRPKRRALSR